VNVSEAAKLRSRRALLASAAGAAGVAVLSGCGSKPLREKISSNTRVSARDLATLNALLDVERYGIAAYAAGLPLLDPSWALVGKQFLGHELAHANEITQLIKAAGAKPRRPPASYSLGDPRNHADALALLEHVERAEMRAYVEMIPKLAGGHTKAALATIFANDAQHLTVLRSRSGQPLPGPFALT
jgi:ferritin-like protein